MTVGTDGLRAELEGLLDDFKALAQVTIKAKTVKRFTESKRLVPSEARNAIKQSVFRRTQSGIELGSCGVEVAYRCPLTAEEYDAADKWYNVLTGYLCVTSNGESFIAEPGWATWHVIEHNCVHLAQVEEAKEVLSRASLWARKRLQWIAPLWPNRSVGSYSSLFWLDVIDAAAEIAGDATLEPAEWCVEVGQPLALWPVSMWKSRKDWAFGHECSPEDEERIGDDPEVVVRVRNGVLKDSLRVIRWMLRKLDANDARNQVKPPETLHQASLNAVVESGLAGLMRTATKMSSADQVTKIMRDMLKDPDCYWWSAQEWANKLSCSKPTICKCDAWREIMAWRESNKRERQNRSAVS